MSCTVKHLKNYTIEQIEALFESDANDIAGVKQYAIIQLSHGCSSRKHTELYRVMHKQICNRADCFDMEDIGGLALNPVADEKHLSLPNKRPG